MSKHARRALALSPLCLLAALACAGCGQGSTPQNQQALRLQREDLAAVAQSLSHAIPGVRAEVAATKAAWPLIANGLAPNVSSIAIAPIRAATAAAARIKTPPLFAEHTINSITGPGSQLAGSFRGYILLSTRSWQMIGVQINNIQHGSPAAVSFARANAPLYIEAIYDAHYSLAHIGKSLALDYTKLGGPSAFGTSLTQSEVNTLANTFSEANDRLHPHDGVHYGT